MQENSMIIESTFIITIILTYIYTILMEKLMIKKKLVAEDMHKKPGRKLPKSGGIGFLLGWTTGLLIILAAIPQTKNYVFITLITIWWTSLVGLYDDVKKLKGKIKVFLTLIPGVFIVAGHLYNPSLYLPFIGTIRVKIVYPLLIPIAYSVAANAINMVDTFTGIAPATTLVLALSSAYMIFHNSQTMTPSLILTLITIASLIGYTPRNMYPGKTFNGDTGTLAWGGILAIIGITGRIEVFLVLAAMPIITNGFTILASIKRIVEHEYIKTRPTIANRKENTITANPDPKAPITLTYLLTLKNESKENEVVIATVLLVIITSLLSIILYYFL